jgi:hypothetical protein
MDLGEREEQIHNLKEKIDKILGCKTGFRRKNLTKTDFNKFVFINIIDNIEFLLFRDQELKSQFGFSLEDHNNMFFNVIDMLLEMNYTKDELELINFYLYGRLNEDGTINSLSNQTTGDIVILETPEDLWNVLQDFKKK